MSAIFNFNKKTVWVSGAGSGIGYQTACEFNLAGAYVIGIDKTFPKENLPFTVVQIDISDPIAVSECGQKIFIQYPQIDILVNVAGVLKMGTTELFSFDDWQECLDVNVTGVFNLLQVTIPRFKEQKRGAIVSLASNAAHMPRVGLSAYCASKAALKSLCLCAGLELAAWGIRSNLISPGLTDTPMLRELTHLLQFPEQLIQGAPEVFRLGIPLGEIATPKDISNTILFLASDLASHITLQDIVVDGGATLGC